MFITAVQRKLGQLPVFPHTASSTPLPSLLGFIVTLYNNNFIYTEKSPRRCSYKVKFKNRIPELESYPWWFYPTSLFCRRLKNINCHSALPFFFIKYKPVVYIQAYGVGIQSRKVEKRSRTWAFLATALSVNWSTIHLMVSAAEYFWVLSKSPEMQSLTLTWSTEEETQTQIWLHNVGSCVGCLVPLEVRRRCRVFWNWSYGCEYPTSTGNWTLFSVGTASALNQFCWECYRNSLKWYIAFKWALSCINTEYKWFTLANIKFLHGVTYNSNIWPGISGIIQMILTLKTHYVYVCGGGTGKRCMGNRLSWYMWSSPDNL